MTNPSKDKGTKAETAALRWLHDNGHPAAYRLALHGAADRGDLCVPSPYPDTPTVVIEVKNRKDMTAAIRDGLNELDTALDQWDYHTVGVLVVKPRGVGLDRVGDWLAIRRVKNDPGMLP